MTKQEALNCGKTNMTGKWKNVLSSRTIEEDEKLVESFLKLYLYVGIMKSSNVSGYFKILIQNDSTFIGGKTKMSRDIVY